jgi:hypothetical protein
VFQVDVGIGQTWDYRLTMQIEVYPLTAKFIKKLMIAAKGDNFPIPDCYRRSFGMFFI